MSVYEVKDYACVEHAKIYGLDESIVRAKYPMSVNTDKLNNDLTKGIVSIAQSPAGSGHDQWLTGVIVQFDLTFSVKAWTEAERYHFLDFVSSQSSMHRITSFDLDETYNEYVDKRIIEIMKDKIEKYNDYCMNYEHGLIPQDVAIQKEMAEKKKQMYLEILYSNPTGFKLTAGITTNYRQLKTIYAQRKHHRLPEWRQFCEWIEKLPHSELIIGGTI